MNKTITIGGTELDIGSVGFTLTFAIADVQDPTKRKAFRSSTITVPATPKNLQAFGSPDYIGVRQVTGLTGTITVGLFTFWGDVIQYGFEWIGRERFISFQIVSNSLVEKLKGVKLSDLDLSSGDHDITVANINSSPTAYVKWGVFDHGDEVRREAGNTFAVERHPGLHIENIINAMIVEAGYILSASLNSDHYLFDFSKLLINKSNFEDDKLCTAAASYTKIITIAQLQVYTLNVADKINLVESVDKGDNFILGSYTIPADGAYRFEVSMALLYSLIAVTVGVPVEITLEIRKDGTAIADESFTFEDLSGGYNFAIDTSFKHFTAGEVVNVYLTITGEVTGLNIGNPKFQITQGNTTFEVTADPRRGLDYEMTLEEILPDIECLDLLKWYAALENLMFIINENTKIVTIADWASFYTGDEMDWTSKLILEEQITVEKLSRPARVTIGYTKDDADIATKNLLDFATTDQAFTEFEEAEGEIILPFGWSLFESAFRYGLADQQLPSVVGGDKALNFKSRILNWSPVAASWTFEGAATANFPRLTGSGLSPTDIKNKYVGYLTNLRDSKTLRASFRLTDFDIHNIVNFVEGSDARTLVRLTTPTIEGLYYLIDVSKWDADTQQAECLLLQVNYVNIETEED